MTAERALTGILGIPEEESRLRVTRRISSLPGLDLLVVKRRAVVLAEIMPTPVAARYGLTSDRAMSEEICGERGFGNLM